MKERTLVGRPDAPSEQDIQLSGLGIMPEHCIITIEGPELYIMPLEGARTCVNGSAIVSKTQLHHGDRVLWGNNHFFRVNCPRMQTAGALETPILDRPIDYEFAREEIMMKELVNDPIQAAMQSPRETARGRQAQRPGEAASDVRAAAAAAAQPDVAVHAVRALSAL
ncbi:hypothetical protein MTO96_015686 [Rhipicephalus appendiculatus]